MGRRRTKNWDTQQRHSGKLPWCNPLYQKTPDCRPQTENSYCRTFTGISWSAYIRWWVSRRESKKRIQQRLYPFFFRSVTAVIPFCSISKTVNQFQSDAIYQAETTGRGSWPLFWWWGRRRYTADFTWGLRAAYQVSGKEKSTCNSADSDRILCRTSYRGNLWSYMAGHQPWRTMPDHKTQYPLWRNEA